MKYETGLAMAQRMKDHDIDIKRAIQECKKYQHGVVALKFSNHGNTMDIEILDEPYDPNVRVYPGE